MMDFVPCIMQEYVTECCCAYSIPCGDLSELLAFSAKSNVPYVVVSNLCRHPVE